jgi:hypothetical protein
MRCLDNIEGKTWGRTMFRARQSRRTSHHNGNANNRCSYHVLPMFLRLAASGLARSDARAARSRFILPDASGSRRRCTRHASVNNLDLRTVGPDKYRSYGNDIDSAGYSRPTACPIIGVCSAPTDTRNNAEIININPVRFSGIASPERDGACHGNNPQRRWGTGAKRWQQSSGLRAVRAQRNPQLMILRRTILLTLVFALSLSAAAADHVRFLVPIVAKNVPGAFGSSWTADTWFHYRGMTDAEMTPTPFCFGIPCIDTLLVEPGRAPMRFQRRFPGELAVLVHVDAAHAQEFQFASRIRDVSRSDRWAGSAVPVIREDAMTTATLRLLDVPVDAVFRNILRVYALPDVPQAEVEIRYYRMPDFDGTSVDLTPVLLRTDRLQLHESPNNALLRSLGLPVLFPFLGQVPNLQDFAELGGGEPIWIEVISVTPGLRFWAMVSITNNETQQVTLVTP